MPFFVNLNHPPKECIKKRYCFLCNGEPDEEESLEEHISSHIKYKPYKCMACNNHFVSEKRFQKHIQKATKSNVNDESVKECDNNFKYSENCYVKYFVKCMGNFSFHVGEKTIDKQTIKESKMFIADPIGSELANILTGRIYDEKRLMDITEKYIDFKDSSMQKNLKATRDIIDKILRKFETIEEHNDNLLEENVGVKRKNNNISASDISKKRKIISNESEARRITNDSKIDDAMNLSHFIDDLLCKNTESFEKESIGSKKTIVSKELNDEKRPEVNNIESVLRNNLKYLTKEKLTHEKSIESSERENILHYGTQQTSSIKTESLNSVATSPCKVQNKNPFKKTNSTTNGGYAFFPLKCSKNGCKKCINCPMPKIGDPTKIKDDPWFLNVHIFYWHLFSSNILDVIIKKSNLSNKCKSCGETLELSGSSMMKHVLEGHLKFKKSLFQCMLCKYQSNNVDLLAKHWISNHKEERKFHNNLIYECGVLRKFPEDYSINILQKTGNIIDQYLSTFIKCFPLV